jgi:hypothetical protein
MMKTLVISILLFFLFIVFSVYSLLPEQALVALAEGKTVVERSTAIKLGSHDTVCAHLEKSALQLNFIPDVRVQLVTGEYIQLQKLIDQKKYIFIHVWSGKKMADKEDTQILDSIAEIYKNKLLVIGLLEDGNLIQLKRLIKKHQLKNVQGLVSPDSKKYLGVNVYPYGILFSKAGKLIEAGMDGMRLGAYMEKHMVISRAKF